MDDAVAQRMARAKELLQTERHVALATVNEDGSPHNSPVFMTFDDDLNGYWISNAQAQHSQNIARSGQVFVVVFSSNGAGGGLYVAADAEVLEGEVLQKAIETFNAKLEKLGRAPLSTEQFEGTAPQRLYAAHPKNVWVNVSQKDAGGRVLGDKRVAITTADLRE